MNGVAATGATDAANALAKRLEERHRDARLDLGERALAGVVRLRAVSPKHRLDDRKHRAAPRADQQPRIPAGRVQSGGNDGPVVLGEHVAGAPGLHARHREVAADWP